MKNNQSATKLHNEDYIIRFLIETIPHYAADPRWKSVFEELANLSEEKRSSMLKCLENGTIPLELSKLVSEKQLSTALEFLCLSLEEPDNPRMMIALIDYENIRVQKSIGDQIKEFMAEKSDFNITEFILDAFFGKPLPGATWRDVLQAFVELSDSERKSYLEMLNNIPYDVSIPGGLQRLLIYNLENPLRAEIMIHAVNKSLKENGYNEKFLA